jgi:predicted amidohydrolase
MNDLRITLLQSPLHWHNPEANRAMFEEKIWQLAPTDIIVLPEMFTTGFTMEAKNWAEPMNLTTFKWLKQQAAQTQAVVVGSYIVEANGQFFNRLLWVQPDGEYQVYDKRHLFRMANEHETYTAGKEKIICEWKGWRIYPLVCYDLRFPVWSRNVNVAYDVLLYVANWPAPRAHAWSSLLVARAIENLAYAVGVNRIGTDGKGLEYSGDSAVVDYKGNYLLQCHSEEVGKQIILSKTDLEDYRQKFPAYKDADFFTLHS